MEQEDPSSVGCEAEPTTSFEALEGLPLQLVALKLSNPGPLLATCTAAHRSVSTVQGFQVEWFCRWAPVLVPYRPWQYAAVTWQRLGGPKATAEQLCSFVLDCIATKRQEMEHAKQLLMLIRGLQVLSVESEEQAAAPAGPQQTPAEAQQQPGQQQYTPTETRQPGRQRQEFTLMPYCLPLPSLIKQARQHLSQGRALKALLLLCPGNPLLLHPYASMAGNLSLLVQLVQQQSLEGPYPEAWITLSCDVERVISTAQLCAFGAMSAGHAHVLSWVLKTAGHTFRDEAWRVKQLLKYAIRWSNRACVVELLEFLPCSSGGLQRLQPWHQHVAMAAARTDPWAADVLQLLLQAVEPKQRAAKYMGHAYYAACRSGHVPVLQQLLDHAATAPHEHMHVLLLAAAEAGNEGVWRQLLQPGGSSSSSTTNSSCSAVGVSGRPPQAPQQQPAQPVLVVPALPWQELGVDDCAEVLLRILDGMRCSNGKGVFDPCQDSRQAAMADILWQNERVGSSAGLWEEVQLAVTSQLALGSVRTEHRGRYGRLQDLFAEPKLGRLLWLHSHNLLQWHERPPLSASAQEGLQAMVLDCVKRRDAAALSTMLQLSQRLKQPLPAGVFVSGAVAAAVDSAVRAGNLAALQQLAAFEQFATLALPMLRSAQMTWSTAVLVSMSAPDWEFRPFVCLAALAAWAAAECAKAEKSAQLGLSVPATAQVIFQAVQLNVRGTEACQQALDAAVQEWQAGGSDWNAGRLEGVSSWFPGIQCSCGLPGGRPLEVEQSDVANTMGWLASSISTLCFDKLKGRAWHTLTPQAQDLSIQRIVMLLEEMRAARLQQQQPPSEPNSNSSSSRNGDGGAGSSAAGDAPQAGDMDAAAATPAAVHVPPGTGQQQPASILPLWQLATLAVKVVWDSKATQGPRGGVATALLAGVHPVPVAGDTTAACGCCTADCRPQGGGRSGQAVAATAADAAGASDATATAPAGASDATATSPAGAAGTAGAGAAAVAAAATWRWGPTAQEQAVVTAALQAYGGIGAVAADLPEVLLHRLDVAAWLLHPRWQELWPMPREAVDSAGQQLAVPIERVLNGHREDVINDAVDRHEAEQLRQHRQQLRQGVIQGFPCIPKFAAAAGELMGVLLLQPAPRTWPGQLGNRLAELLAGNSSAVQVEKVKAMLAVLASVPKDVLDRSWHLVLPAGLRQVCGVGDIDLMALLLLYDKRGILAGGLV